MNVDSHIAMMTMKGTNIKFKLNAHSQEFSEKLNVQNGDFPMENNMGKHG